MREQQGLLRLLRGLAELIGDEAAHNPEFARRLEGLLSSLRERKGPAKRSVPAGAPEDLPDVYAERTKRGEAEFRLWLRDQPVETLRAIIRLHDLDATRRTAKWKDTEKLSGYIADQMRSRLARGSSFLKGGNSTGWS